ncbi:MAG TPA: dihydropteroate synthase [Candidatus Methylacidiphilales bacterium]|jgi:dihydropteroate synthase|nr:dihydropteroate synthase [Candidatus Methylacidiphilales bacterium]
MLDLATLAALHGKYREAAALPVADFALGPHRFDFEKQAYLMGVVNLSADSWYRESVALSAEAAIGRGRVLREQGAAIVDVGAESTLAHAAQIGEAAQKSALLPVVRELASAGICVSVETYHPSVTTACLKAGAKVLNLTGTADCGEIFREVADFEAGVIICFVQGENVREVGDLDLGRDPVATLYEFFARQIDAATEAGVSRIWIDPGLGFYYRNLQDSAARVRHQMHVFLNSFRLRALGWPVCQALPHAFECFEDEVRAAEPFFSVLALLGQASLLRTHEIAKVRGVLRTMGLAETGKDIISD